MKTKLALVVALALSSIVSAHASPEVDALSAEENTCEVQKTFANRDLFPDGVLMGYPSLTNIISTRDRYATFTRNFGSCIFYMEGISATRINSISVYSNGIVYWTKSNLDLLSETNPGYNATSNPGVQAYQAGIQKLRELLARCACTAFGITGN